MFQHTFKVKWFGKRLSTDSLFLFTLVRMKIDVQNPLTTHQETLLQVRKAIISHSPGCNIEIKDSVIRNDYVRASAQIKKADGTHTSVCHGYVAPTELGLPALLQAELIALVFCASEIGLDFEFNGGATQIIGPKIAPRPEMARWDYETIAIMKSTPLVLAAMKRLGLKEDMDKVKKWMDERKTAGERTHPKHIAEFLFGAKTSTKYVAIEDKPDTVKEEKEAPQALTQTAVSQARSTAEAQSVMDRLSKAGITHKSYAETPYKNKYSNLTLFALKATESEINDLCESE